MFLKMQKNVPFKDFFKCARKGGFLLMWYKACLHYEFLLSASYNLARPSIWLGCRERHEAIRSVHFPFTVQQRSASKISAVLENPGLTKSAFHWRICLDLFTSETPSTDRFVLMCGAKCCDRIKTACICYPAVYNCIIFKKLCLRI